jgi:hypothetical protein
MGYLMLWRDCKSAWLLRVRYPDEVLTREMFCLLRLEVWGFSLGEAKGTEYHRKNVRVFLSMS